MKCSWLLPFVAAVLLCATPFCPALGYLATAIPLLGVAIYDEERRTINQVARDIDKAPSTVWRWIRKGVRGVKLETYVEGAQRYTTVQALDRFRERCTAAANGESVSTGTRTASQRLRAIEQAEAALEREGI